MGDYIGTLVLGTTSNRFIVFDRRDRIVGSAQKEHEQRKKDVKNRKKAVERTLNWIN